MAAVIEGVLFLIIGIAVLSYDFRSWIRGTVRIGHAPKGTIHLDSEYVVNRNERPVLFLIGVIIYGIIGIGLIIFAIFLFTGNADPLTSGVMSFAKPA